MKTILVPTDFSKNADNALRYAVELAKKGNYKIILLHAYHISFVGPFIPTAVVESEIKAAEAEANSKLRGLCMDTILSGKVRCEYVSWHGQPVDAVMNTIKKKKADIVIMGTKGASGIKEVIIGTNAAEIVEKASCPVIAVPENAIFKGLKKIVYATDYHNSDISALKNVMGIAGVFNSEISVIHVCDGEYTPYSEKGLLKSFEEKVRKGIHYPNISFHLAHGKHTSEILTKYAGGRSTDLLVMSTHYRTLGDKLFNRSVTKKMAYHTKVPLMSFHLKEEPVVFI